MMINNYFLPKKIILLIYYSLYVMSTNIIQSKKEQVHLEWI